MEHERADDAYENWDLARRKHAQPMEEWIDYVLKVKMEVEARGPTVVISKKQHASKMVRGARVAPERRAQAPFNSGGVYDPSRMETVLRVTFPRLHGTERRLGQVEPRG